MIYSEVVFYETGWLLSSRTTSRYAKMANVNSLGKGKTANAAYDDWSRSGKACFPSSRDVTDERGIVPQEISSPAVSRVYAEPAVVACGDRGVR